MNQLIDRMFLACFPHPALAARHDGAVVPSGGERIAFTTDSYVINPIFFPGGDIGSLAVYGTANDLAMCGALPRYLSLGFILEEGLPMDDLWTIVQSIGRAAAHANVDIVTGDTKVVERGKGDGIYINTAGVGTLRANVEVTPSRIRPDDIIILSGDIGRHGSAVMAARGDVEFSEPVESDCAPLSAAVEALLEAGIVPHCLRDLTRGGLATALVELATASHTSFEVEEAAIEIDARVSNACEVFGLDPLYVANEGRFVAVVDGRHAREATEVLRQVPAASGATRIGVVGHLPGEEGMVVMNTRYGTGRLIDLLSGEQLPRIC